MKNWKKPMKMLSAGVLISGVLFTTSVDAASVKKRIEAYYNDIKIVYKNQTVAVDSKTEPFIANETTYVPLRMMGELFDKNLQWNGATNTITVYDKTTPISPETVASLKAQINAKDVRIAKLQAELNNLKAQQEEEIDLDDLEDQLNDDYGDYDDFDDVEIFLGGDEDEVDIRINVDSYDWKDLYDSEKEDFLQEITDDILDDFEDADIKGTVKDGYNGDLLATFDTDSDGDVNLEDETVDLNDLELQLVRTYANNSDIDEIDIYLSGDADAIDVIIEVNESDWDSLTEDEKENFIEDIVEDILDEYEDAEIEGTIESSDDNDELDEFEADYRGRVTIN